MILRIESLGCVFGGFWTLAVLIVLFFHEPQEQTLLAVLAVSKALVTW